MKKFLAKLFSISDFSRKITFALTLLTIGNYLWLSFFLLLALWIGKILKPLLGIWSSGAASMTIFSLARLILTPVQIILILHRERRFKALWYLLPACVCLALGAVGFIRVFPPLFILEILTCGRGSSETWLSAGFPGLPPGCWAAVFFLSLLLILAGGLFLTAFFTTAEGKKFRSAFGPATLTLWGVFVLGYFFTLGLALYESRACSAVRQAVEKRFGRPVTAAGLEQLYRESGKIDAGFWARQEELREALPKVTPDKEDDEEEASECGFWALDLPDRPTKETFVWYGNYCRENRAALEKYESCFDREPPLSEKRFVRGNIVSLPLPTLGQCRYFVRGVERGRLIAFLAAKNTDAAWACYRRMGNVGAHLQKAPFLIGSLVWIYVEQQRLDCVEKLLASRLLPDAKLDELDADLAALERDIPRNHQQAMYTEAVFGQDVITGAEEGLFDWSIYRSGNPPGALAPYRWIFPQCWYHAAMDKKTMLRNYLAPDFTQVKPSLDNDFLFMTNMLTPAFETAGRRFYALTARARGMRVLIRAEKHRRKHGAFPKTLSDLPEDPFTGKPLIYGTGPVRINELIWEKTVCRFAGNDVRTVDAVWVRGDPAVTEKLKLREDDRGVDPTRAMIRLSE